MSGKPLVAPFPWFGGKRRVAPLVWQAFGDDIASYTEPFFGSGAVLLGSPYIPAKEQANDLDGFVCNFWRAVQADPESVAKHANWPVNECDLRARHAELTAKRETLSAQLMSDARYFDAEVAGWWVWGLSCWIGSGWCDGKPSQQRPYLRDFGQGVHSKTLRSDIVANIAALSNRLRFVRFTCGDWMRVCSKSVVDTNNQPTRFSAVFLDPPYADTAKRQDRLYAVDSLSVAHDVRRWAIANGDNPRYRICLAGYEGEHEMPDNWQCVAWKSRGTNATNAAKERLWFSPACLPVGEQPAASLFQPRDDQ